VVGAAPFIAAQGLLARGEDMKGALVRGVDPALEGEVTDLFADNPVLAAPPGANTSMCDSTPSMRSRTSF
jgi:ABC-type lipoprotein release transport system permease subunit